MGVEPVGEDSRRREQRLLWDLLAWKSFYYSWEKHFLRNKTSPLHVLKMCQDFFFFGTVLKRTDSNPQPYLCVLWIFEEFYLILSVSCSCQSISLSVWWLVRTQRCQGVFLGQLLKWFVTLCEICEASSLWPSAASRQILSFFSREKWEVEVLIDGASNLDCFSAQG